MCICDMRPACDLVYATRVLQCNRVTCVSPDMGFQDSALSMQRRTDICKLPVFKYHKVMFYTELLQAIDESGLKIFNNVDVSLKSGKYEHTDSAKVFAKTSLPL